MGGKAKSLQRLQSAGFRVPLFFVVEPHEIINEPALRRKCSLLAPTDADARFAVRSSAQAEDGSTASYAGMFDTFLFVEPADVADRVERVRASAASARVVAYDARETGTLAHSPSAIVQVMIDADVSGVAFGRDPVDGSDRVVIAAAFGTGSGVVSGDCDADTYRVERDGRIVEHTIGLKTLAHRRAATLEGIAAVAVPTEQVASPALCAAQVAEIAQLVRAIGDAFDAAQDVEWAISERRLYVLQARPVTTPAGTVWDNSNISESYGGIVLPLTFSFVRYAYAGAYRQLMHALAISDSRISANREYTENLLGLVEGRMYYNLMNWYKLLALMPGFRLNRRFMETMMGVAESPTDGTLREIEEGGKANDALTLVRTIFAPIMRLLALQRDIRRFHILVNDALVRTPKLETLSLPQLQAEYARLERCLLSNWEAPLVNDFFAMVFYGLLRKLCATWCADFDGAIHNDLLCAEGGMISTQPAVQIAQLAELTRGKIELLTALERGTNDAALCAMAREPNFKRAFDAYLSMFGDRCQSELKLESITLHEDPLPLLRGIARLAQGQRRFAAVERGGQNMRNAAQARVRSALRGRPVRALIFSFVLSQARERVRDRENLRFERTRVFACVRRIFTQIGQELSAAGEIENTRDIFFLEVDEVSAAISQPGKRAQLRTLVDERRARYTSFETQPDPPDHFTAIGTSAPLERLVDSGDGESVRYGLGCCPGFVRARVRVVTDPQTPLQSGEIVVAQRTDPGWIVLFPSAAGILVERGSLLSHAAIVSREMGIPSVVALPGLTRWLRDGDLVEFDGRSGRVSLLERANPCIP